MYDQHYGFSDRPFQLTPDPRFWFDTATHKKAMAYLGYGMAQGEGFIVITGDIGAGKTTLVGHLVDTIDPDRLNVIKIVSTQIDADDLLRIVCTGLSVDAAGLTKAQMLSAIERGLHGVARGGRRTLLIVDEAQALPVDSLEELRMLSNFQAGGGALLQIFLLGQPEFRDKLGDAALEQLRQRVIAMHHLGPMDADELEAYLIHRLTVVGWSGRPDFDSDALAAIYDWSGGIPRRVNQLVSRVLLHGAIEGIDTFGADDVAAVIGDMDGDGMSGQMAPIDTVDGAAIEWPFTDTGRSWRPIAVNGSADDAQPRPIHAAPVVDGASDASSKRDIDIARRLADIDQRLEDQDAALRRVLTLLVDWVEGGIARPEFAGQDSLGLRDKAG